MNIRGLTKSGTEILLTSLLAVAAALLCCSGVVACLLLRKYLQGLATQRYGRLSVPVRGGETDLEAAPGHERQGAALHHLRHSPYSEPDDLRLRRQGRSPRF